MNEGANRRKKLVEKIRALMAKTTANGCTEAEAMAAAEMVARLRDQYDLTMTDIEMGGEQVTTQDVDSRMHRDPLELCLSAIAKFCHCKVWKVDRDEWREEPGTGDLFNGGGSRGRYHQYKAWVFCGLPHDIEIAGYILQIAASAMERGALEFTAKYRDELRSRRSGDGFVFGGSNSPSWQASVDSQVKAELNGFLRGMAATMAETLRKMAAEREGASEGKGLILSKMGLIESWMADHGIRLGGGGQRYHKRGEGWARGQEAGASVTFNPGVRGGSSYKGQAIGRRHMIGNG